MLRLGGLHAHVEEVGVNTICLILRILIGIPEWEKLSKVFAAGLDLPVLRPQVEKSLAKRGLPSDEFVGYPCVGVIGLSYYIHRRRKLHTQAIGRNEGKTVMVSRGARMCQPCHDVKVC